MTIKEVLSTIVNYPVPEKKIEDVAVCRGLELTEEIRDEIRASANFRLAEADILRWVSFAPNVSQGGVSYNLLYSDRQVMRETANLVYKELEDKAYKPGIRQVFSFKGEDV